MFASIVCEFSFGSASGRQFYLSKHLLLNCSFSMGLLNVEFIKS